MDRLIIVFVCGLVYCNLSDVISFLFLLIFRSPHHHIVSDSLRPFSLFILLSEVYGLASDSQVKMLNLLTPLPQSCEFPLSPRKLVGLPYPIAFAFSTALRLIPFLLQCLSSSMPSATPICSPWHWNRKDSVLNQNEPFITSPICAGPIMLSLPCSSSFS